MKNVFVKMFVLLLTAALFFSTAYAEDQSYLILEGPDVVVVGQSIQYKVSCVGATETEYVWYYHYRTNDCADIDEKGLFTAVKPGIIGIGVFGNKTGLRAALNVEVQPNEVGGVAITGPDKVIVGDTVRFTATYGGAVGEMYQWIVISPSMPNWWDIATVNGETGDLTAVGEGTIVLSAVHWGSGLSGERQVLIVGKEKKLPTVSVGAGLGYDEQQKEMVMNVTLTIMGTIPDECPLYIAVKYNDSVVFLPAWQTEIAPYRTNPTETFYEKVLSIPLSQFADGAYTFYAALLNSSLELASNLSTSATITISKGGPFTEQGESVFTNGE